MESCNDDVISRKSTVKSDEPNRYISSDSCVPEATHEKSLPVKSESEENIDVCERALWGRKLNVTESSRVLIKDISVCFPAGRLSIIMGPSGAGKTTLLNALAGRTELESGEVGLNDSKITDEVKKYLINYVFAVDRLNEFLTVQETLNSASRLKNSNLTYDQQIAQANEVIRLMKLEDCRDVLVGGTWRKGISKGQMKRVCVAQELLGNPIALILDEPTTGLDASLAYELMDLLRAIAEEKNMIIICTVHQPNLRMLKKTHNVTLLNHGEVIYNGPPDQPMEFWDSLGQISNPSLKGSNVSFEIENYNMRLEMEIEKIKQLPLAADDQLRMATTSVSWREQFCVSFWRSLTESRRSPVTIMLVLLVNIVQAILLGCVFWKIQSDVSTINYGSYIDWKVWETPIFTYFAEGIDRKGRAGGHRVDPLVDLLKAGINGNGRSFLFDFISGNDGIDWLANMVNCSRNLFPLNAESPNYPKYYWPEGSITSKLGSNDSRKVLEHEDSNLKDVEFGCFSIEQFMGITVSAAQMFDMVMQSPNPWKGPDLEDEGVTISYWFDFAEAASKYVSVFLCCAGNRYGLDYGFGYDTTNTMAKPCSTLFPGVIFPTFPSFPSSKWEDTRTLLQSQLRDPAWAAAWVESIQQAVSYINELPVESPPARQLGSGLGGMVTDLYHLLVGSHDSPMRKLIDNMEAIVEKLNSADCIGKYCYLTRNLLHNLSGVLVEVANTALTVLNICGTIFFLVGNLGFASYDVLLQFPKQRAIFNKERANGNYRTSSYLLGKMSAELPFHLAPAIVWALICWYMIGLDNQSTVVLKYLCTAAIISFSAYSMGYLTSAILLRLEPAIVASPLILVCMFTLAGFFLRDPMIPAWIRWAKHLSIYRYAYFAVCLIQFPKGGAYGSFPNSLVHAIAGVTNDSLWQAELGLIIISLACRLATYFCVKFLHTKEGTEA